MTVRPLFPHQADALRLLRDALMAGSAAPMVQAPTGFGKTRLAAEIVDGALGKGKRVLIVVPALSLIDQTVAALELEGILDIGVMQGLHRTMRTCSAASVQVASVQTLQRRPTPKVDLILIDEAHRWYAFFDAMIADAKATGVPVIGLSATPWTRGLGKHFDRLLTVATTRDLIDGGYLSPFRVFAPAHPDLSGVATLAGDYHEGQLADAMNSEALVADVVSTWLRHGGGRPTLCFAVDRAHAAHLQREFLAADVPAGYVDARTDREARAKLRHQFHRGGIKVVVNVGCLTTGVDWDVRCIILARPTKSEMLYTQMIGRGLRTADGKADCLVLDHSDTTLRLGFVTDIQHDELDDGTKPPTPEQQRKALPTECPGCHFLRPPKVAKCPACGFKPERQSAVEVADGELVELGAKRVEANSKQRAHVLGQFRSVARRKGYAEGWASHKYHEFFGVWPRQLPWAPEVEPTPELLSWIKSRQIAFAKAKERRHARAS